MSTQIVKILVRRGTDAQRRTAEGTGVLFTLGEIGYSIDTNRLYIGDGVTYGGRTIGMRNLGFVSSLFGTFANTGLSQDAYYACTLSAADTGDIIYDLSTRSFYTLTGTSAFPPLSTDFVKYDFTVHVNPAIFSFDSNNNLNLNIGGVGPQYLSQGCVGNGLVKYDINAPITIANNGIVNTMLAPMDANTVKVNYAQGLANPQDLYCGENQVIGRTIGNGLTAIGFSQVLAAANFNGLNGVLVQRPDAFTTNVSLNSNVFTVANDFSSLSITTQLNANSLTVSGNTILQGLNCQAINTNSNSINAGNGNIYCNQISSGQINTNGNQIACGNLHAAGNLAADGTISAGGDVIAFNTSDARLKDNLTLITNSLDKIDVINGYEFDWNEASLNVGHDVGLVAQEVAQILPQAVKEKNNGYFGVDYQKVIPLLVSCIKDLKTQVEELKNEVRSLSK